MTLNVVPFVPRSDQEIDAAHAAAIQFLEDTLERAKREKSTFVLVIMQLADGGVLDGWSHSTYSRPYVTAGALAEVTQRFIRKNIEQA